VGNIAGCTASSGSYRNMDSEGHGMTGVVLPAMKASGFAPTAAATLLLSAAEKILGDT